MYCGDEGFKAYKKNAVQYMRPYELGESMQGISVSAGDKPEVGGMIAINTDDGTDKWYVSKELFESDYTEADAAVESTASTQE